MTVATVPDRPVRSPEAPAVPGRTPRAAHMTGAVRNLAYAQGHGGELVCGSMMAAASITTTPQTLRFYVHGRADHTHRVWQYEMHAGGSPFPTVTITFPDGSTRDHYLGVTGPTTASSRGFVRGEYVEEVATTTTTPTEITLGLVADQGTAVMTYLACWDVPRSVLTDSDSNRVSDSAIRPQIVIHANAGGDGGIAELEDELRDEETANSRRSSLFAWSVDDGDAEQTTSGTYADVFSLYPTILGRHLYDGVNVSSLNVRVRAAGSGDVRLTMDSGDVLTLSVSTGATSTFAWHSGSLDVDTEDYGDAAGKRSGAHDECQIEYRSAAPINDLRLAGISIGEPHV